MLAIEEQMRQIDLAYVESIFELSLSVLVLVQVALFVAHAVILQDFFDFFRLVERGSNNLQASRVHYNLVSFLDIKVSLQHKKFNDSKIADMLN